MSPAGRGTGVRRIQETPRAAAGTLRRKGEKRRVRKLARPENARLPRKKGVKRIRCKRKPASGVAQSLLRKGGGGGGYHDGSFGTLR